VPEDEAKIKYVLLQVILLCLAFVFGAGSALAWAEAPTHEFNPLLSLTGGCGTSTLDPVPDPGCPEGSHPPGSFAMPRETVTDIHGDMYVASYGKESANGAEGRIDIFNPEGLFIWELADSAGPKSIAVDSKGSLYVFEHRPGFAAQIRRFPPSVYEPEAGNIKYEAAPVLITENEGLPINTGIAINPVNDHLFVHYEGYVAELGSAEEGNKLLESSIGKGILSNGHFVAVDAADGRLYASDSEPSLEKSKVRVFELDSPHSLLETLDGSTTPSGKFATSAGVLSVAAEEKTGHVFVYDSRAVPPVVYEFTESGEYVSKISHGFKEVFASQIAVDNGSVSPNEGMLLVPSDPAIGHSYAFSRLEFGPPIAESVFPSGVTEGEAKLNALVNPNGLETHYVFEYTTQQSFEAEGFTGAVVAGEGEIASGKVGVKVFASVGGLLPETSYRYRVVAENEAGNDEGEAGFATYEKAPSFQPCPNEVLRVGPSALLPDCRAYELVTPANTNGRTPDGVLFGGDRFTTFEASPDGSKVSFMTLGGTIPGGGGTGNFNGDPYLATREETGWSTSSAGPTGDESVAPVVGSVSLDQGYSFWTTAKEEEGSAEIDNERTHYTRYPDGHSALTGRGSLDFDPLAEGKLISENGGHIIFVSSNFAGHVPVHLEEEAPPEGTQAIYDRTSDEVTHVVSLLPGSVTPTAGENAFYIGASLDGRGVIFEIGSTLYLRRNDSETYEVAKEATFAGASAGGARVFYLKGGNLFAFDVESEETIAFSESGDVSPVNVSSDGTGAYFLSPSVLTGEENPNGEIAQAGQENLYLSEEGTISFVGTVTERDAQGELRADGQVFGLGLWISAVSTGRLAIDPSRVSPNGGILLFESRADLTGYDPEGHDEVYRYDATGNSLQCLSCNPTQVPASGQASLQSIAPSQFAPEPFSSFGFVPSLRADGDRAFFQSTEALVVGDTDGLQDVYEWEADGVGSCEGVGGCVYLISSGHSSRDDYIYGISETGDDVFFRTSDLLAGGDAEATPSIYDARVEGGFPEVEKGCQLSENCSGSLSPPPFLPAPASPVLGESGNVTPGSVKHCPKGQRRVKKHGHWHCVKRHHRKKHREGSSQHRRNK
jgi:hypothetical protein